MDIVFQRMPRQDDRLSRLPARCRMRCARIAEAILITTI